MKPMLDPAALPVRYLRLKIWLALVTAILAMIAVGSALLAFSYQRHITEASRYNSPFDLGQTGVELLRLQLSLREAGSSRNFDEVSLRLSILRSRLEIFSSQQSTLDAQQMKLIGELKKVVDGLAPLTAAPYSQAALDGAVYRLEPFTSQILRLSSTSHAVLGDNIQKSQGELSALFAILCFVTMTFVAFGAVLLGLVFRQNSRLARVLRIDPLTGIANRIGFSASIAEKSRADQAMIILDVDHFKTINDTLGHASGDRILVELSHRLATSCLGATVVARIGGDEFAVLYTGPDAAQKAVECSERILLEVRAPFEIDGRTVRSGVSLGISTTMSGSDASTLFSNADTALYEAKKAGRNKLMVYHPDMNQELMRRSRLQHDLNNAIANNELFLLFQPIVDLRTDLTLGFEALLRWRHGEFGLISPSEFIPIAEHTEQIGLIGSWVINAACQHAALLPDTTFIAVNVSASQLTNPSIVLQTRACLTKYSIEPHRLEIEITESTLIENDERALSVLHELRTMGCRVSLDDFGTGYASLSYLRRFPFDKIKIDQSFVRGASHREEAVAIITGTCDLAHRLKLTIVAEGIETEEHREIVRTAGSHQGQGYLFGRPLTAKQSTSRIARELSRRPKRIG
ncbi:diguanylate cyclase (GGDEF)-like protein [Agrobacterium pusense]|uniref:putative bifunctional diguanylate cyclase/phosphodiesterase n=1 Tax=Agrobacterium pusense TaxID=648995 RepID=UPI00285E5944|nr:EAL domain-containing protein [Agrobacterium pusense]MDR6192860.1 diguanylate cyclase (GGDEF)-like protein [Agrobacterium pusense]